MLKQPLKKGHRTWISVANPRFINVLVDVNNFVYFQFLENMQLKYDAKAKERNVYVIGACGWDSIPSEMGTIFVQDKFSGTLGSINTNQYID